MRFLLSCFFLLLLSPSIFAWNSVGHRLVAQIAYDELTPQAKAMVDQLTAVDFSSKYPEARFLRAATWPDRVRSQTHAYDTWHYVDFSTTEKTLPTSVLESNNVVSEILRAEKIVADSKASLQQRALYLNFLVHFVGDIHQPLHCATLYNTQFPNGDRGGNLYPIDSPYSKTLHSYWDLGLGMFARDQQKPYAFHYWQIEAMATTWMKEYPRSFYGAKLNEKSPMQWAQESHALAIQYAYTLPENTVPSQQYVSQGQAIVKQQIVLAGYRLADILNAT